MIIILPKHLIRQHGAPLLVCRGTFTEHLLGGLSVSLAGPSAAHIMEGLCQRSSPFPFMQKASTYLWLEMKQCTQNGSKFTKEM